MKPDIDTKWHQLINQFHKQEQKKIPKDEKGIYTESFHKSWMYQAKTIVSEVPRLTNLFKAEREGTLDKEFKGQKIDDNHLTCVIRKKCRECSYLKALENKELKPETIDEMKAWTCVTHITHKRGETPYKYLGDTEAFITTVDDYLYWSSVYESLADNDQRIKNG